MIRAIFHPLHGRRTSPPSCGSRTNGSPAGFRLARIAFAVASLLACAIGHAQNPFADTPPAATSGGSSGAPAPPTPPAGQPAVPANPFDTTTPATPAPAPATPAAPAESPALPASSMTPGAASAGDSGAEKPVTPAGAKPIEEYVSQLRRLSVERKFEEILELCREAEAVYPGAQNLAYYRTRAETGIEERKLQEASALPQLARPSLAETESILPAGTPEPKPVEVSPSVASPPTSSPSTSSSTSSAPPAIRTTAPGGRTMPIIAGVVAAIAILGGAAFLLMRRRPSEPPLREPDYARAPAPDIDQLTPRPAFGASGGFGPGGADSFGTPGGVTEFATAEPKAEEFLSGFGSSGGPPAFPTGGSSARPGAGAAQEEDVFGAEFGGSAPLRAPTFDEGFGGATRAATPQEDAPFAFFEEEPAPAPPPKPKAAPPPSDDPLVLFDEFPAASPPPSAPPPRPAAAPRAEATFGGFGEAASSEPIRFDDESFGAPPTSAPRPSASSPARPGAAGTPWADAGELDSVPMLSFEDAPPPASARPAASSPPPAAAKPPAAKPASWEADTNSPPVDFDFGAPPKKEARAAAAPPPPAFEDLPLMSFDAPSAPPPVAPPPAPAFAPPPPVAPRPPVSHPAPAPAPAASMPLDIFAAPPPVAPPVSPVLPGGFDFKGGEAMETMMGDAFKAPPPPPGPDNLEATMVLNNRQLAEDSDLLFGSPAPPPAGGSRPGAPPSGSLAVFTADETIQYMPGYGSAPRPGAGPAKPAPPAAASPSSGSDSGLDSGLFGDETKPPDMSGEESFEAEKQKGMTAFREARWDEAVQHLSIAASLRPDAGDVKEQLRRARRMRKEK